MFSVGNRVTVDTNNYAHLKRYTKAIGTITKTGHFNCCDRYYVEFDDPEKYSSKWFAYCEIKSIFSIEDYQIEV